MPFGELLEQHRVGVTPVTIHRERLTSTRIAGVVRQFSKRLVLIEVIGDAARADEFALIRREDLTRVDWDTADLRQRVKKLGAIARTHPIAREVDLVEWRTAIASAQRVAESLLLHREGVGDPIRLASRSIKLGKQVVTGQRPDPSVADEGEIAIALDHLTRIDLA